MQNLKRLIRDKSGAAVVEFAMLTAVFFVAVLPVLDFGAYFVSQNKLGMAVSAAGNTAFGDRDNVDFAGLPDYVRNATGVSTATVTTTCNGAANTACTNVGRSCACISSTGTYTANACEAACPSTGFSANQKGGYYMTINASYPYSTVILPSSILKDMTIRRTMTVRLQ